MWKWLCLEFETSLSLFQRMRFANCHWRSSFISSVAFSGKTNSSGEFSASVTGSRKKQTCFIMRRIILFLFYIPIIKPFDSVKSLFTMSVASVPILTILFFFFKLMQWSNLTFSLQFSSHPIHSVCLCHINLPKSLLQVSYSSA